MTQESNKLTWRAKLDLAKESKERARIQEAKKQQMVRKYNKKVNP